MKNITKKWVSFAKRDLEDAEVLFKNGDDKTNNKMAKSLPERVKKFIKDYTKTLKSQIKVEKVILFGSYVYGKQYRDSDIDLIVLSPDFKKMDFMKRLIWLSKMRGEKFTTRPMDIFGYTLLN